MKILSHFLIPLILISCNQDFLDVKPSSDTVVPSTLEDFQQLLDADFIRYTTELTDLQADDYYLTDAFWQSINNIIFRNAYVWAGDIYETEENELYGWNIPYQQIFYANVVLEGLDKIVPTDQNRVMYSQVKGSAHFTRAWAIHQLLQLYAPTYNAATADRDPGVALPGKSDVNEKMSRSSNKICYEQILDDLITARDLLASEVDFGRPSKVAAWSLLARVYLDMGDHGNALSASSHALEDYNDLTDLNITGIRDFRRTIYLTFMAPATIVRSNSNNTLINEDLYAAYTPSDLRKSNYFRIGNSGKPIKNSFHGLSVYCFSGLDTDEQYFIKAECEAYLDRVEDSMETLNHLLKHRHLSQSFVALTATGKTEALGVIRAERRKELVFRGVRWMDLKRYNRDGANIALIRTLGDRTFTLPPNSDRWLFPIPPNEIQGSGLIQNPR